MKTFVPRGECLEARGFPSVIAEAPIKVLEFVPPAFTQPPLLPHVVAALDPQAVDVVLEQGMWEKED